MTQFLPRKLSCYGRALKSITCVALTHKIAYKSFGSKKINELVVTSSKLANNFVALVTSGLGSNVACGLSVGLYWLKLCHVEWKKDYEV
jgi:hypothetical protein